MIATKYGKEKWGWWPKPVPNYRRSGILRAIASIGDDSNVRGETLYGEVAFLVGDGQAVRL